MELMDAVKKLDSRVMVMVITVYGTIEAAVAAIKKGAYDYIPKPFKMDELEVIVNRALERHTLFRQLGVFRGLTLALIISVPFWLILGIVFWHWFGNRAGKRMAGLDLNKNPMCL